MPSLTNEQIRLFASYLNITAAAALVAAMVTEPFSLALTDKGRPLAADLFVLISFSLSIVFHGFAQLTLRRLKVDEP